MAHSSGRSGHAGNASGGGDLGATNAFGTIEPLGCVAFCFPEDCMFGARCEAGPLSDPIGTPRASGKMCPRSALTGSGVIRI